MSSKNYFRIVREVYHVKGGRKVEWMTLRLHECVTRNTDGTFTVDKAKAARVLVADLTKSVEWVNEGIRAGTLLSQPDLGVAFNDTQAAPAPVATAHLTIDGPNGYRIWFAPTACSLIAALLHKGKGAPELARQLREWLSPRGTASRVMTRIAQVLIHHGEEAFASYAGHGGVSLVFRWPATLIETLD